MTEKEAMEARHSVRAFDGRAIEPSAVKTLRDEIARCNAEGDLNIQLVISEPEAFDCFRAHYGKFSGVTNYIAMIGKKGRTLDERLGYYGERLVLLAQTLGLNTCWVALTYKKVKTAFKLEKGERLRVVIALGYGMAQGTPHKSKPIESVCRLDANSPEWFVSGVKAALLAPTAMNQQKFFFEKNGDEVCAGTGKGFYARLDLGIAKYHFEVGSGRKI